MIARLLTWLRSTLRSARPLTSTERSRRRRARLRKTQDKLCNAAPLHATLHNVASVAPPHREKEEEEEKYIKGAHAISEKWEPDEAGRALGVQAFGAGLEAAIARHRDTWMSRPERLTEAQWQAKWRAWCRLHIAPPLPLGPQLVSARKTSLVFIKPDAPQWAAWEAFRGKPLPVDKAGGWWVASEWPPGHEASTRAQPQRRESG